MNLNVNNSQSSNLPKEPLSASVALAEVNSVKEPKVLGDWILWIEQRPWESGRSTLLARRWQSSSAEAIQELTPSPINVRTRVHTYGGGAFTASISNNQLTIVWIDDNDGCLWQQLWESIDNHERKDSFNLKALNHRLLLSAKSNNLYAGGLIDLVRKRWIGIMEFEGRDFIVSFNLQETEKDPKILYRCTDFCGYLTISFSGSDLAWIEWQRPSMPWEVSQLYYSNLNRNGEVINPQYVAGSFIEDDKHVSVFQPLWLQNGDLVVAEDSNGWWNLIVTNTNSLLNSSSNSVFWRRPWSMNAEIGLPQWTYGMSVFSEADNKILAVISDKGLCRLSLLNLDGKIEEFNQHFDDLSSLHSTASKAIMVASNSSTLSGLLKVDLQNNSSKYISSKNQFIYKHTLSHPESLWFDGYKGKKTHAWYYPPTLFKSDLPPLLVKIHSGPTAMASKGLNPLIQFWTSRGWGVVDVNYGGSTGFGRSYRDRLKFSWGIVDVFDCALAAKALINIGKADPDLIAIEGGSAGGFTALSCLCFTDIFRVAACRYAVTDLTLFSNETHRFEEGYLEYLIGNKYEISSRSSERSPINNIESINCPVIFFQGLKDKVVPPGQTERISSKLRKNNIPVEVYMFEDEGHGFKDSSTKIEVLEKTERFFNYHLKL